MTWSGLTKYIKSVCQDKCKPIEFPHLGIFLPVMPEQELASNKLTQKALQSIQEPGGMEIKFLVNQAFLNSCGGSVRVAEDSTSIQAYDPVNAEISPMIKNV
jgi:hypothetical protein